MMKYINVPVMLAGLGGQPATLTTGRSMIVPTLFAPVGLGRAACTPPKDEHVPTQITAAASAATRLISETPVSALLPIVRKVPLFAVGTAPSAASRYWPL